MIEKKQSLNEKKYDAHKKWIEDMLQQTFTKDSPTNRDKQ